MFADEAIDNNHRKYSMIDSKGKFNFSYFHFFPIVISIQFQFPLDFPLEFVFSQTYKFHLLIPDKNKNNII